MEEPAHPPPAAERPRREFIADLILTAGCALGLGSVAYRFLQYLYPVVPPVKLIPVLAGKVGEIPEQGVRFINLPEGPVMLERIGKEVRALSAICTHLGCTVHWDPGVRHFVCPCHHGVYAFDGKVISGPPPRPLPELQVKLQKDQVFVMMTSLKEEQV